MMRALKILMKKVIKWSLFSVCCILFSPCVLAISSLDTKSVAGYWQTIDDKTQKPSSIIKVRSQKNFYIGTIAKIFSAPGEQKAGLCTQCKGNQKNKPILGLEIIKRMTCESTRCYGGTILDPRDGKIYHATMMLIKGGRELKVRGYIGMPIFGKSVIWYRVSGQ